jgi:glycolate oxidase FAD binding subunit
MEPAPMTVLRPADEKQLSDAVAWAAAEKQPLEVVAGGSKRAFGRPVKAEHRLDLSQIAGVVNYEPAELILTARPATPLASIKAELQAKRQMLAFEPPDLSGLMGSSAEPTLGGALACNLAGPRRVRTGAARDFFLGFSAVNGVGEIWKAGGKVVKNVTGYDMMKLMAGSFGTLSVLTEVTLKVTPRPESECTILLRALADKVAIAAMAKALNTPFEVSSVAHLPPAAARRLLSPDLGAGLGAITAVRLEGPSPSVAYRADAVESVFSHGVRLDSSASAQFWSEVGEVHRLLPPLGRVLWRLCPTPSFASIVVNDVRTRLASAEGFFDWGGGLVWLSLDAEEAGSDAGAAIVRAAMKHGGHSTLVVAPEAIRERIAVFEPSDGPLRELAARIKMGFDPSNVLNPGRMREDQ